MYLQTLINDLKECNSETVFFSFYVEGNHYVKLGSFELVRYKEESSWEGSTKNALNDKNALLLVPSFISKEEWNANDFI